jgi:hypothetical protein
MLLPLRYAVHLSLRQAQTTQQRLTLSLVSFDHGLLLLVPLYAYPAQQMLSFLSRRKPQNIYEPKYGWLLIINKYG